jgi:anti-anti-sigma regulatory factor
MKYHIVEDGDLLLIKISGKARKNEALLAKRLLSHYITEKGTRVIFDLKELEDFEPTTLLGVLNGIRKEIGFLRAGLKLCRENRLDQIFQIYEDEEMAKNSGWKDYGKR